MRLCSAWHPDQFRKHRAGETPALLSIDFQTVWEEEWQAHLLNAALNRVKRRVKPGLYEMYYLHVVKEQPAHEVARTLGVSAAQVYLAKHRVGAGVAEGTQTAARQPVVGNESRRGLAAASVNVRVVSALPNDAFSQPFHI